MKKILATLCVVAMLVTMFSFTAMAEGEDLVITGFCPVTSESNAYKFMTIKNNSSETLNLYNYVIGYAGKSDGSRIKEITCLKGGTDWVESTVLDVTKVPVNPDEANIPSGQTVVVWLYGNNSYGDGTAAKTVADFKAYWGLADNAMVICFDESTPGEDTNFKLGDKGTAIIMDLSVEDRFLSDATVADMNDGVDDADSAVNPGGDGTNFAVGTMNETVSFMFFEFKPEEKVIYAPIYKDLKGYKIKGSDIATTTLAEVTANLVELPAAPSTPSTPTTPSEPIDPTGDINTAPLFAVLVLGIAVVAFASKKRFAR